MNYYRKIGGFVFTVLLLLSVSGFSQEQVTKSPTKKWVYEFYVMGIGTIHDAEKLDSMMTRMVGIYSCKTDFLSKKVVISCIPGIGYPGLKTIMASAKVIANENYLTFNIEDNIPKE